MNKTPATLLIGLFLILTLHSRAQSVKTNLYPFNYVYVNPALSSEQNIIGGGARIENRGQNYGLISFDGFIKKINSGVGFIGYSGKDGAFGRNSYGLFFNHRIQFSSDWSLRLGTKIYRQSEMSDFSMYLPIDPNDPLVSSNFVSNKSFVLSDLAFVVNYKKIYVGFTSVNFFDKHFAGFGAGDTIKIERSFNAVAGGKTDLTQWLNLDASVYMPNIEKYSTVDLNALFTINKIVIAGATFRTVDNSIRANAGVCFKDRVKLIFVVYESDRTNSDIRIETLLSVKI